jgi:hypothetical protein
MSKKYISLEHAIRQAVAEQNYKKKTLDESISPVDYDKPKEVPQAFFKQVHIEPRTGSDQIQATGPVRSRRNVEKEKSSETMHPNLKEEKKKEPTDEELADEVRKRQERFTQERGTGLRVGRRLAPAARPPLDPEKQKSLEAAGKMVSTVTGPAAALTIGTQIAKGDLAGAAGTGAEYAIGRVLAKPLGYVFNKGVEGARALSKRFDAKAKAPASSVQLPGATIETPKPGVSTKVEPGPAANAPTAAAPAASASVAGARPRDVTRQSFRNFLKKQEPSKTVELPGATIETPKPGVSTKVEPGPAANDLRKMQTPETMGIVVKKQDIPKGKTPSANENIPASEFAPPTPKGTGTEGLAPAPRAAVTPKAKPDLKVVTKEKPKPEPKAEPEPVAPPRIREPSKTTTGKTIRLPGVEITTPRPGISVPTTTPRPSREQDNIPSPDKSPAAAPTTAPEPAPSSAPSKAPSAAPAAAPHTATPGQQNMPVVNPQTATGVRPSQALPTPEPAPAARPAARAAEKPSAAPAPKKPGGKGKGKGKTPFFPFGGGAEETPGTAGGGSLQIGGSARWGIYPSGASMKEEKELSRYNIKSVARPEDKREEPIVPRPNSDRNKTMSRLAQLVHKVYEEKKVLVTIDKKKKEEGLGKNPLVNLEPELKHNQLDQGS